MHPPSVLQGPRSPDVDINKGDTCAPRGWEEWNLSNAFGRGGVGGDVGVREGRVKGKVSRRKPMESGNCPKLASKRPQIGPIASHLGV